MSSASRSIRVSTLVLTACLSLAMAIPAAAQNNERKTKQTVAMSQAVYEKLTEIQELVEAESYAEGQEAIRQLQAKGKLTPYEKAQMHNLAAYTYYLMDEYPNAIRSYERVLLEPELPEALQQSTLKTLAQLHFTVEDYPKARPVRGA